MPFPALLAQSSWENLGTQGRLIVTGAIIVGAIVLYGLSRRIGRRLVNRLGEHDHEAAQRYETLWAVIRKLLAFVTVFLAILFIFIVWEVPITPFLAMGTVLAAAIGFGAQDVVRDFLAGFFILAEDQFHLGDTVTIAGTTGTVEDIQLRVTVLRDLEGNVHFVPNGQITVTSNFTSKFAQPVIDVGIAYEADVDRAIQVFLDELKGMATDDEFGQWVIGDPEVLGVNRLDDSAVVLRGRITTTADQRWMVKREALRRVKKRFDAEGINIPFPQVTLNQKS